MVGMSGRRARRERPATAQRRGRARSLEAPTRPALDDAAVWHDVECGDYTVDLPLWRELAAEAAGAVLDLGAGTGRVALELAAEGHELMAIDSQPALVSALAARARACGLAIRTCVGDVRTLELRRHFALAIAPMQVAQLLGGADGRRAMLAAVGRHLPVGGLLAVALADPLEAVPHDSALPPLPDVRELDGWVFSSRPTAVGPVPGGVAIERVREAVSPDGELTESVATVVLDDVSAAELATTGEALGYRVRAPRMVPATDAYVGSTVVLLERA